MTFFLKGASLFVLTYIRTFEVMYFQLHEDTDHHRFPLVMSTAQYLSGTVEQNIPLTAPPTLQLCQHVVILTK